MKQITPCESQTISTVCSVKNGCNSVLSMANTCARVCVRVFSEWERTVILHTSSTALHVHGLVMWNAESLPHAGILRYTSLVVVVIFVIVAVKSKIQSTNCFAKSLSRFAAKISVSLQLGKKQCSLFLSKSFGYMNCLQTKSTHHITSRVHIARKAMLFIFHSKPSFSVYCGCFDTTPLLHYSLAGKFMTHERKQT